jgi:serine/threonine-protein phosphatase 2A regulatory subunit A
VEKLNPICITWLSDSIYSIREAALNNVKLLTEIFGPQWAVTHVIPKLLSLHVDKSYLHRLTPLFGMATLATVLPPDVIRRMFVPVIITLQQDPVPNIRMNVAKSIQQMYPTIKNQLDIEDRFRTTLREFI